MPVLLDLGTSGPQSFLELPASARRHAPQEMFRKSVRSDTLQPAQSQPCPDLVVELTHHEPGITDEQLTPLWVPLSSPLAREFHLPTRCRGVPAPARWPRRAL